MTSLLVQELLRRSRKPALLSSILRPGRFHTCSVQQSTRKTKHVAPDPVSNKLESFLAQIESTKHHVSVQDIEAYKPKKIPRLNTPEYEAAYNELTATLFRSFSKEQFLLFFRDTQLRLPRRKTKTELISAYVENRWGWTPVAKNKEEKRKQTEVSEQNFPMTTEQSFLLMGKGGSNLLKISHRYNVHLAFTYNPLSLKVEGVQSSLDECKSYMQQFYRDIHSESIPIDSNINVSADMLLDIAQSISRATGVYLSTEENNNFKITYLQSDISALEDARYLLQKQLSQVYVSPLVASVQTTDMEEGSFISSSYSLYPFSSTQPLPWQAQSKSAFRLRQVGKWLSVGQMSNLEPINLSQVSSSSRLIADLKTALMSCFPENHKPHIAAIPGHILFLSSGSLASRLLPPLKGSVDFLTALRWSDNHPGSTIFLHSSPLSIPSGCTESADIKRAVYIPHETTNEQPSISSPTQSLVFESSSDCSNVSVKSRTECSVDVLLPDRAYDLRLVASYEESVDLPNNITEGIFSRMKDDQRPGLSFEYNSNTYILGDHLNINKQTAAPHRPVDRVNGALNTQEVSDVTTDHKYVASEIVCQEPLDEIAWSKFLTDCAHLTTTA